MAATDELAPVLKKLRLSGILQTLALRIQQAADDNLAYSEFLLRVLSDEAERRDAKQLQLRVDKAHFDRPASLEDFDFFFNPEVPKAKIIDLATCAFIERNENVLLVGKTGVGKSHIAQAIGHRACRMGKTVLFQGAHELFVHLRASRADGTYDKKFARLLALDLVIIDDLGLRTLVGDEPFDLYELIRQRHQRGSIVITSNRAVEEWAPLFGEELVAAAAMDRLLEDAHVVEMTGDTYRNPPSHKRGRRRATATAAQT